MLESICCLFTLCVGSLVILPFQIFVTQWKLDFFALGHQQYPHHYPYREPPILLSNSHQHIITSRNVLAAKGTNIIQITSVENQF